MSLTYVSAELRRLVAERSLNLCEYCLLAEVDTIFGLQVDHIISEKHGGPTTAENLAHACLECNLPKGTDVGSINWDYRSFVRFFDPRIDRWADHFCLNGPCIESITLIGSVTVNILRFNTHERLLRREDLIAIGCYPPESALRIMQQ